MNRLGKIYLFILNEQEASTINERRNSTSANMSVHRGSGAQTHAGNLVKAGDVFPMMITRIWGDKADSAVNGQVFLDGGDTLWVSSVNASRFQDTPQEGHGFQPLDA